MAILANGNVEFTKITKNRMLLSIGLVTLTKMVLRGVTDLSFVIDLYGMMNQKPKGARGGIELTNGDCIVAVKVSSDETQIISAYNRFRGEEDVASKAEQLINSIFKITLATKTEPLTARSISTVGKGVSHV